MNHGSSRRNTPSPKSHPLRTASRLLLITAIAALLLAARPPSVPLARSARVVYSTSLFDAFGAVPALSAPSASPSSVIVGAAATKGGLGAVLAAADGSVYATGNAQLFGSMAGKQLFAPIVGIALTPDNQGYWLVGSDGSVFAFGDAHLYGSMAGTTLNAPVVGIAATANGAGYWLVAADGGIFTFGDATFYGSMGGTILNAPVMGMALSPDGKGYWLVGNDGGVFTFGDAVFHGSLGAQLPNTPINGILSAPGIDGYWLLSPDSLTYSFTPTPNERLLPASTAIVNAAASQIGPATQANFCNPYGPCEEWCALFAAWAWNRGGIPAVSDGFTGDLYQWAATHTSVISANQTPAAGDIVFYGTGPQNTETSVHDGIVVQTWPDGSLITVEGDSGPGPAGWLGVTVNGPFQAQRSIEANGDPIYGYGEPS